MKHFLFGLLLGSSLGLLSSFLKDENGQRVGKPLKDEIEGLRSNRAELSSSLKKAKRARNKLAAGLPAAKRAISDIQDEVTHFEQHSQRTVNDLQYQSKRISQKISGQDRKN